MEAILLNVMGSMAVASAVIAGKIATRLSRELSRTCEASPEHPGPERRTND
ncbi:hypothetical protein FHR70_002655 [Microvirga lupini]|uniref:Uncharacterized protein n=1 Tax=Microvirga lupini TaxID=420324 RepID=A0A7W4VMP6_9HYPH|nr:hypothetical protein [Microvirga lupini]